MHINETKNKPIICHFCNQNHNCRECPLEAEMAPILKTKVGEMMEHYVAWNFPCPGCGEFSLEVMGTHTPSLDIICNNCPKKIEVKSKCLSLKYIPEDITILHGHYLDFLGRIEEGLEMIIIIYSVDRIRKTIKIREILYISNDNLKNRELIDIDQRRGSNLSIMKIFNKNKIDSLGIPNNSRLIDFSKEVKKYTENEIMVS